MEHTWLIIDGMSCGHCVAAVTRALESLAGVEVERVEVGSAKIQYDPQVATQEWIARAVQGEGYEVKSMGRVP